MSDEYTEDDKAWEWQEIQRLEIEINDLREENRRLKKLIDYEWKEHRDKLGVSPQDYPADA